MGRSSGLRQVGRRILLPPKRSGVGRPERCAEYSGGPAHESNGLPYLHTLKNNAGAPIENMYYRRAIPLSQACGQNIHQI
jgi:hypothetical protein